MIDGSNKTNWLCANIDKIGSGSYNTYVDIRCVVSVIDEKVDNIGRLIKTLQSASKKKSINYNGWDGKRRAQC